MLALIFFSGLVNSSFATGTYDPKKCLKNALNDAHYDQIFGKAGYHHGLYDQTGVEALNENPLIQMSADLQLKLSEQIAGIPPDYKVAKVLKGRGKDGKESETVEIGIYPFHPDHFRDSKKRSQIIRAVCDQVTKGVASEICEKSMNAKMEYFNDLYQKHDRKIKSMSEEVLRDPRTKWEDLARGYDFTYEPDKNLPLASVVYIDPEELAAVAADSSGKPIGFALPIGNSNGKIEFYFVPNIGTQERPLFLNPYFFVFGGTSANEWNRKFGLGELKVSSI